MRFLIWPCILVPPEHVFTIAKSQEYIPAYLGKDKEARSFCARKKLPSSVLFSIKMDGGANSNA